MIAPKLENGDFVIESGEWLFVEGDEELAQATKATMQMRRGEFFLEPDAGMIFDNLLGRHTNKDEARDDIIEAVSQESRIRAVSEIEITDDAATRKRNIFIKIEKESGELISIDAGIIGEGVN